MVGIGRDDAAPFLGNRNLGVYWRKQRREAHVESVEISELGRSIRRLKGLHSYVGRTLKIAKTTKPPPGSDGLLFHSNHRSCGSASKNAERVRRAGRIEVKRGFPRHSLS